MSIVLYSLEWKMVGDEQRWFSIDSKSFEIKAVGVARKVQVVITER